MKSTLLAVVCAMIAGCAALAALECDTDWYETGRRDGRLGAEPQIESYAARCGGKVDRDRYSEGWEAGMALRPRISVF